MRNSIRRGLFVIATAGFALLGFGLAQASAATPALPSVPSVPSLPTMPGMDGLDGIGGLDGLGGFGDVATMRKLPAGTKGLPGVDTTMPGLGDLSGATKLPTLPAV